MFKLHSLSYGTTYYEILAWAHNDLLDNMINYICSIILEQLLRLGVPFLPSSFGRRTIESKNIMRVWVKVVPKIVQNNCINIISQLTYSILKHDLCHNGYFTGCEIEAKEEKNNQLNRLRWCPQPSIFYDKILISADQS